jgi:tetraprenyl-beta-curcumene synthase
MVPPAAGSALASAATLTRAASQYWLGVFPLVRRERRRWTRRAEQIPNPALRQLAVGALQQESGNVEGASAFATLVPHGHRSQAIRALSTFQVIYDYVDTLVEQQAPDPVGNGLMLHLALRVALDAARAHPDCAHPDYYIYSPQKCDGGYLRELVEGCQSSFNALPCYQAVRAPIVLAVDRMVIFQSLNHSPRPGSQEHLADWALSQTSSRCGLRWWESAAATASSLTAFALIVASSRSGLRASSAWTVHNAYYPWVGALHVLLDSLLDQREDLAAGRHSLIQHYGSPLEAAQRMGAIAREAAHRTQQLPNGRHHRLILAAMTSFYLSAAPPASPYVRLIRPAVLRAMGELARPTMLIMRARHRAAQLRPHERAIGQNV